MVGHTVQEYGIPQRRVSELSLFDLFHCSLQQKRSNKESTEGNFGHYLDDYLNVFAQSRELGMSCWRPEMVYCCACAPNTSGYSWMVSAALKSL